MKSFRLDWDADYGIDHRRGWSVHVDGEVVAELRRTLIGALWTGWRMWRRWQRDLEQENLAAEEK